MLNQVTSIPPRFFHLALLNVGLIVALCKDYSLLYMLTSLFLIAVLAAPLALHLRILHPPPITIIRKQVHDKVNKWTGCLRAFVDKWPEQEPSFKINFILHALLGLYLSINYICPCVETFLFVNAVFAVVFMTEELEQLFGLVDQFCSRHKSE